MTARKLETLISASQPTFSEEEFSIPLDMSDLISICREYSKLGSHIQNQVENILEVGVAESINSGILKQQSLPHIKNFLKMIYNNPYFGEAGWQAKECYFLIDDFLSQNTIQVTLN